MPEILNSTFVTFLSLFFTIDVIGITPLFVSLTSTVNDEYRNRMATTGVVTAFLILLFFAVSGTGVLNILGISLPAFRIAGGILLLILSIDMVLAKPSSGIRTETQEEHEESLHKSDISVFPLAIPLLSGPAAITMVILFMKQAEGDLLHQLIILTALFANMVICWIVLIYSSKISNLLGKTGVNVLNRIFGILLTALACQFFIDGILQSFFKK